MNYVNVELCAGTSCHLMGASDLMAVLSGLDKSMRPYVRLKLTHCLGNCGKPPNCKINGELCSELTADSFLALLKQHIVGEKG